MRSAGCRALRCDDRRLASFATRPTRRRDQANVWRRLVRRSGGDDASRAAPQIGSGVEHTKTTSGTSGVTGATARAAVAGPRSCRSIDPPTTARQAPGPPCCRLTVTPVGRRFPTGLDPSFLAGNLARSADRRRVSAGALLHVMAVTCRSRTAPSSSACPARTGASCAIGNSN